MKEIKEEIVKKEYVIKWEAIDGEIFKTKDECERYENSALTVLASKYNKLVLRKESEYSFAGVGSDDNTIEIIKVNNTAECDIAKQMYCLINRVNKDTELSDWAKAAFDKIDKACKTNDFLIIGRGCDVDECFWVIGTRKDFLDELNKEFDIKTEESKPEPEYGGC